MLIPPQKLRTPARRVALLLTIGAIVGIAFVTLSDIPDEYDVIPADGGAAPGTGAGAAAGCMEKATTTIPAGGAIAADGRRLTAAGAGIDPCSYPGSQDGFVRGMNDQNQEVYRYEQNNQVYVVPANDYYAWRNDYYHDGYNGGLTSTMLHALLFAHLYSVLAYPRTTFYSTYHWHTPHTAYYSSPAYTRHYGSPVVANGHIVHRTNPTYAAAHPPKGVPGGGTPVARATPVATGRPVTGGRPVGGAPIATGRPVATATPVAKPVAHATPVAKPAAHVTPSRPTASRWRTVRHSHSFRCFASHALVTLADGRTSPISAVAAGDYVLGWPNAAAASAGKPARAMRVSKATTRPFDAHAAPLRGLALSAADGRALTLPPFVTTNHPMLTAGGKWAAVDAALAHEELEAYIPDAAQWQGRAYAPPPVGALTPGVHVYIAPAGVEAAGGDVVAFPAALSEVLESGAQVAGGGKASVEYTGSVYSLELDVAELAVYIVNGVLVMD